jgi:curved DNA-binding protein CbpA
MWHCRFTGLYLVVWISEHIGENMRDYYRDMDLAHNATQEEIKGQYRRLAKQYHPDRNQNNPYAEQRFKEVSEAYSVLSDATRRLQYDRERNSHYNQSQSSYEYNQSSNAKTRSQRPQEAFNEFFNSPLWGAVKGFAGNMAQDFVQGLDDEIQGEFDDVDPFVERVAKITARNNPSGSISVTCSISKEDLRELTSLASKGMDIEDFSADVGVLFASALSQAIMQKWRGY